MYFNRKTIRLENFDYSNNGYYFVTICTQNRKNIFGEIKNNQMILNKNGFILKKWLLNLINRFNIKINDYQIMPNHLHMIIEIVTANYDLFVGAIHESPLINTRAHRDGWIRAHRDAPLQRSLLSKIIGYLKMNVSKEIGIKLFQRNYYEHIIRNEKEYLRIKEYIKLNPRMWYRDRNNFNKTPL